MTRLVPGPQISGVVYSKQTGAPLAGVTVTPSAALYTTPEFTTPVSTLTTDGEGGFAAYAQPGVYTFTISDSSGVIPEPVEVRSPDQGTSPSATAAGMTAAIAAEVSRSNAAYAPIVASPNYVAKRARAKGGSPLGSYTPASSAFPTVTVSAADAASTISGAVEVPICTQATGSSGAWASGTTYTTGQGVISGAFTPYGGTPWWIAVAGSTGVTPGTDPTKWAQFTLDSRFSFLNGPATPQVFVPVGTGTFKWGVQWGIQNASTSRPLTPVFGYTGTSIDLELYGNGGAFRLIVDGVVDPAGYRSAVGSDSKLYRVNLAWGSYGDHQIIAQLASGVLLGLAIEPTGELIPAALPSLPVLVSDGDSINYGINIDTNQLQTYSYFLGQMLGMDVIPIGQGGTGILNPGTLAASGSLLGSSTAISRLPIAATFNPTVFLGEYGLNDQSTANVAYTPTANQAGMAAFLTAARAAMPTTMIFMVGPMFNVDNATDPTDFANIKAVRDAQVAAFTAAGATTVAPGVLGFGGNTFYIDTLLPGSTTVGWYTGRYGVSGSANILLSSDGIHPLSAGHRYMAKRIVAAIISVLSASGLL